MKRKLMIEELDVETFVVAPGAAAGRGTVRAHCDPQPIPETELSCVDCTTGIGWTCIEDLCQPTFVYSCGGDPELCGVVVVP